MPTIDLQSFLDGPQEICGIRTGSDEMLRECFRAKLVNTIVTDRTWVHSVYTISENFSRPDLQSSASSPQLERVDVHLYISNTRFAGLRPFSLQMSVVRQAWIKSIDSRRNQSQSFTPSPSSLNACAPFAVIAGRRRQRPCCS